MSETKFAALQDAIDRQNADEDVLSDNKVSDLVTIANGNVIANEQQTVITHLGLMSGFLYSMDTNVNTILTGASAGGKSKVQDTATKALPLDLGYEASDASSMGVLDDDAWDTSLFAPLDEWQKIPDKLTEIMKGVAGGPDDVYRYVRSVEDSDANSGRSSHTIEKYAKPYTFLYAQHALDHELSTRLVFLPIDDNSVIRDAIIEQQGGADHISVEGYDKDFIFPTVAEERAMRAHIRDLPTLEQETSNGDINVRGGSAVVLPPWVRKAIKPIFDLNRTETNRVSGQVFNLVRASTILNHDERRETTKEYAEDDVEVPAYIAAPQDVANVMSCRETLLAKTHHLTQMKREILDAIRSHQHFGGDGEEGVGVTLDTIRDYLDDSSDLSVPRKAKMRDLLKELSEHYYIAIHEGAGANNAHLYEFRSLRDIGMPRVTNLDKHMDEGEIQKCKDLSPNVDLEDPFADSTDPFRGQPFKQTVEEMRSDFASNPVERAAEKAELAAGDVGGDATGDEDEETTTLAGAMGAGGSEVQGPDGPVETAVHERLRERADDTIWVVEDHGDLHMMGEVDDDTPLAEADLSGTVADPEHELWDDPRKPDSWVETEGEAQAKLEDAWESLEQKGLIEYDVAGQPEGFVATHIKDA